MHGGAVFQERSFTYEDGLLSGLTNRQRDLDHDLKVNWLANAATAPLSVDSIADAGDWLVKRDETGTPSMYRKLNGEVVSDPTISIDAGRVTPEAPQHEFEDEEVTAGAEPAEKGL